MPQYVTSHVEQIDYGLQGNKKTGRDVSGNDVKLDSFRVVLEFKEDVSHVHSVQSTHLEFLFRHIVNVQIFFPRFEATAESVQIFRPA